MTGPQTSSICPKNHVNILLAYFDAKTPTKISRVAFPYHCDSLLINDITIPSSMLLCYGRTNN